MSGRLRVLVIGGGSIGERHVRCFQQTGRADVSLCEVNRAVRHEVAGRYGLRQSFADFDAAVDSRPDVAVICTPADLHVAMAQRLAESGIHLLIEKPLSTGLEGVERLCGVVRERGLVAAVAYVYRAHPALGEMRREVASGRFGRPVQLVAVFGQNFPFYRPAYRTIYYRDRATGGGAVQDALTHVINAGEWLVGPVTQVVADAAHQLLEGVDVEDTVHVIARHGEARVLGSYALNQHQAPNEGTITVVCERGTARFEMHRHHWLWADQPGESWHETGFAPLERDTLFIRQADQFLDAAAGNEPPLCPLDEGFQTLKVNLAVLASVESRAWQTIS